MTWEEWTTEEQGEVLRFYGLESLTPTEWQDLNKDVSLLGSSMASMGTLSTFAPAAGMSTSTLAASQEFLSGLASLESTRQLLRDDVDPLELKDSNYIRQLYIATATAASSNLPATVASSSIVGSEEGGGMSGSIQPGIPSVTDSNVNLLTNKVQIWAITSATFDPLSFLRQIHGDTSFADLIKGRENLKRAMSHREESIKNLVKANFDRFVNAKNASELVFKSMLERRLADPDHGMRRALDSLAAAFQSSQEVFGRLMARRDREQTLRQKLEMFERFDFVLSLGHRLTRYMRMGEYASAVADYRKAKTIMTESASGNKSFHGILQKVWTGHIEATLNALRSDLQSKLKNPIFSYKVHAKLIDFLLDLDARPHPVLAFYNDRKTSFFTTANNLVREALNELSKLIIDSDPNATASLLLEIIQNRQYGRLSVLQVDIAHAWRIKSTFLSQLTGQFQVFFRVFGKFMTALVSKRFNRDGIENISVSEKLTEFAHQLVESLPSYIDQVWSFDLENSLGITDTSLLAANYSITMGIEFIRRTFEAIYEANLPDSMTSQLIMGIQKSCLVLLERTWSLLTRDALLFPRLETWQWSGEGFDFSTILIKNLEALIVYVMEANYQLITCYRDNNSPSNSEGDTSELLLKGLDGKLADTIGAFLEALLTLAHSDDCKDKPEQVVAVMDHARDVTRINDLGVSYRVLAIITNVLYLREAAIPNIFQVFTASLGKLGDRARNTIMAKVESADRKLCRIFLDTKRDRLLTVIQTGTINSGFDWSTNQPPTSIRPYVLTLLLELVSVQTQILDVSAKILKPLMSELVLDVFQEYFKCIQMLQTIGIGGYLQLRGELDLLQGKLITLMTDDAINMFNNCVVILDSATPTEESGEEYVCRTMSDLVGQWDASTQTAFICFQYS